VPASWPFMRENVVHRGTSCKSSLICGWEVALDSAAGGAPNDLGTRSPVWIPIVHDGLDMRNNYVSMNAGSVQNERPTTRSYPLEVAMVRMPLGNGKASVLDEQAWLAKYITTQEDEAPSLSVKDVMGPLLAR